MEKVLFVCLGNICRSPMAEAVLRQRLTAAGITDIEVDSAATSGWEAGNPPHRGTQRELAKHGIDCRELRSRQIGQRDFETADWIIGMDEANVADLKAFALAEYHAKIQLFLSVVPGKETQEVPDPYYTGDFSLTYQLIDEGLAQWLPLIQKKQKAQTDEISS